MNTMTGGNSSKKLSYSSPSFHFKGENFPKKRHSDQDSYFYSLRNLLIRLQNYQSDRRHSSKEYTERMEEEMYNLYRGDKQKISVIPSEYEKEDGDQYDEY